MNTVSTSRTLNRLQPHARLGPRVGAAVLALLATACFAAPTDNDIKQAVQLLFPRSQGMVGDFVNVRVKSVSTIGCEKSGSAFICDIEMEMSTRAAGSAGKTAMRVRMVKGKDGWRAIVTN